MIKSKAKVVVYIASIKPLLEDNILYEKLYNQSSLKRKVKTDKMRSQIDKCLSVGVEELLKRACLNEFGFDLSTFTFKEDEYGKPWIDNNPFYFSLSHSGDCVMCAVSTNVIGCDVEKVHKIDLDIAKRFFSSDEFSLIQNEVENKNNIFFRLWTLKESFMKCTGLGFHLPLNSFSISLGEKISVFQNVSNNSYAFFESSFDDLYKYGCCVKENNIGEDYAVSWKRVEFNG